MRQKSFCICARVLQAQLVLHTEALMRVEFAGHMQNTFTIKHGNSDSDTSIENFVWNEQLQLPAFSPWYAAVHAANGSE